MVLSVTTRTYRQIASPPELLSRVMATVRFVSWGAIPVGGLIAGALAGPLGARTTLLIFAAAAVCAPLVLLLSPVRPLRDLTDHTGTTSRRVPHQRSLSGVADHVAGPQAVGEPADPVRVGEHVHAVDVLVDRAERRTLAQRRVGDGGA